MDRIKETSLAILPTPSYPSPKLGKRASLQSSYLPGFWFDSLPVASLVSWLQIDCLVILVAS